MYYHRIFRVRVFNQLDYLLISALIGSLAASYLKKYSSEKAASERLKNSIIKKSKLVTSKPAILNSKNAEIEKIYRLALNNRGGQFEDFEAPHKFSNENFKLAHKIKEIVDRLAWFFKDL